MSDMAHEVKDFSKFQRQQEEHEKEYGDETYVNYPQRQTTRYPYQQRRYDDYGHESFEESGRGRGYNKPSYRPQELQTS